MCRMAHILCKKSKLTTLVFFLIFWGHPLDFLDKILTTSTRDTIFSCAAPELLRGDETTSRNRNFQDHKLRLGLKSRTGRIQQLYLN